MGRIAKAEEIAALDAVGGEVNVEDVIARIHHEIRGLERTAGSKGDSVVALVANQR